MYAKVFAQIFDGTLCTVGPWESLVTFQQMLILADQDGQVDMTATAISRRTTIPLEIIEKGITALLLPDPESRTPTEEGRRIVPLSDGRAWGWRIVNYKHYRQLRREEDRRSYHREYWHERKAKTQQLNTTQHTQPNQPIAEAEAEAKAEIEPTALVGAKAPTPIRPDCPYAKIADCWNRTCQTLPKVKGVEEWADSRRRAVRSRWSDKLKLGKYADEQSGVEYWKRLFEYVEESDFLRGKGGGWRADFDWVMNVTNLSKVIEGKYENKTGNGLVQ